MTDADKISQPIGAQTPDVLEWSKTLRSRSPSPTRQLQPLRSSSPSPRQPGKESGRRSPSPIRKSRRSNSPLRKSTGSLVAKFNMSGKINKSADLSNIEAEYIKNLQQQIYFLELEANYLREQAKKATDMHPKMTTEAERMLNKLRQMQAEMDGLQLETNRKDSVLVIEKAEKEKLTERIRDEEEARSRDKRMLMDEVVQAKKQKDSMDREVTRKDAQLLEAKTELDKSATALKNAELKIQTLRSQLEQRTEMQKTTQIALEEKRSELISVESQLREIEDKYYSQTVQLQDKLTNDLRDEIRLLRQQLKEVEMNAEQEKFLRTKMSDDATSIARQNAQLEYQVAELQGELGRERNARESHDQRHSQSISEFVQMKDREKELRFDLEHVKEHHRKEQERNKTMMEQLMSKESVSSTQELQLNTSRSRVYELESESKNLDVENTQLRKDKILLVEHVSDIQKKMEDKDNEIVRLRVHMQSMESRVRELQQTNNLESSIQTQKWNEFERLAESMRSLSHTMAESTTPARLQY